MRGLSKTDWRVIMHRINDGKCTPIISDRAYRHLLPKFDDIPKTWANYIDYPLHNEQSITHLAQYLSVNIGDDSAKVDYIRFIKAFFAAQKLNRPIQLFDQHPKLNQKLAKLYLSDIILPQKKAKMPSPLNILAKLPIPIFLTTSYFNFIEKALTQCGKNPQSDICPWNDKLKSITKHKSVNPIYDLYQLINQYFNIDELTDLCFNLQIDYESLTGGNKSEKARELINYLLRRRRLTELVDLAQEERPSEEWPDRTLFFTKTTPNGTLASRKLSIFRQNINYEPTAQNPLVYHLFGTEAYPSSIVLTEDNYLDYLIRISQDNQLIHPIVSKSLSDSSLLLLGYKIHDWDFRALFRGIISKRHGSRREISIAIQLDPEEYSDEAQHYLEDYFREVEFKVYWGTAQQFLSNITEHSYERV